MLGGTRRKYSKSTELKRTTARRRDNKESAENLTQKKRNSLQRSKLTENQRNLLFIGRALELVQKHENQREAGPQENKGAEGKRSLKETPAVERF